MITESRATEAGDGAALTCSSCRACCCRLEVMLMGEDEVPLELTKVDRWGGRVMARLADGWCAALDRDTMRCRIYARRPAVCREFRLGGDECITERSADPLVVDLPVRNG
jgi:Fe-S-cluster containining protein